VPGIACASERRRAPIATSSTSSRRAARPAAIALRELGLGGRGSPSRGGRRRAPIATSSTSCARAARDRDVAIVDVAGRDPRASWGGSEDVQRSRSAPELALRDVASDVGGRAKLRRVRASGAGRGPGTVLVRCYDAAALGSAARARPGRPSIATSNRRAPIATSPPALVSSRARRRLVTFAHDLVDEQFDLRIGPVRPGARVAF
jgi:hypothetical protein